MGIWNGIELNTVTLDSARLRLREWRPSDAGAVFEGAQDHLLREFLPIPDPYTSADAQDFVQSIANQARAAGTGVNLAVVEQQTHRLVGSASLRLPSTTWGAAEVGYSVYPWARGQAYAAEVADALARWAFERGVRRVEVRCSVRNLASVKSALAAGFAFETIMRSAGPSRFGSPGAVADDACFARLATDPGEPIHPVLAALPTAGLSDGGLMVRVAVPADAAAFLDEHNDALSRRWAFDDRPADAVFLTAAAANAGLQWLVGPVGRLTMVEVTSGEVAGSIQLRLSGPPQVGSIGYGVRPGFRGHGYTTRALRLLAAWAFGPGGFARLELGAKLDNIASQKAAAKAGFSPDGVRAARLRNPDGTFSDEVRFAAVRPDLAR